MCPEFAGLNRKANGILIMCMLRKMKIGKAIGILQESFHLRYSFSFILFLSFYSFLQKILIFHLMNTMKVGKKIANLCAALQNLT